MDVHEALRTLTVKENGTKALEFLGIASCLAPVEIEINIFSDLMGDTESFIDAVKLMKEHSVLEYVVEPTCILINKEVREEFQKILIEQQREEELLNLVVICIEKLLKWGNPFIFDHAMHVFTSMKKYPESLKRNSKFHVRIVETLLVHKRNSVACNFGLQALEVLQGSIGEYHESTIQVQTKVGLALFRMKQVKESLTTLSEAYKKTSIALGQSPINEALVTIAEITADFTSIPESTLRKLVFGDASVLETNNNMELHRWCEYATLLTDLKWKRQALLILYQVLEKRSRLLGRDDDDICYVEECIGHAHIKLGEFHRAFEVYRRAYEKRRRRLGENCIRTHLTRRGLALAYQSLGMLDEALAEYEAAADGIRRISGDKDFAYLITRCRAASVLFLQKRYERAYRIYSQHYGDFAEVMGKKHIETLNMKYDIGRLLVILKKPEEALKIWEQLLPDYLEVLGPTHPQSVNLKKLVKLLSRCRNICFLVNEFFSTKVKK